MPTIVIIMLVFGMAMFAMGPVIAITTTRLKHRQKLEEMQLAANVSRIDDDRLTRQDSRVELLEDRVQVLERIITDRGYDVATQIEALRDARQDAGAELKFDRRPER